MNFQYISGSNTLQLCRTALLGEVCTGKSCQNRLHIQTINPSKQFLDRLDDCTLNLCLNFLLYNDCKQNHCHFLHIYRADIKNFNFSRSKLIDWKNINRKSKSENVSVNKIEYEKMQDRISELENQVLDLKSDIEYVKFYLFKDIDKRDEKPWPN